MSFGGPPPGNFGGPPPGNFGGPPAGDFGGAPPGQTVGGFGGPPGGYGGPPPGGPMGGPFGPPPPGGPFGPPGGPFGGPPPPQKSGSNLPLFLGLGCGGLLLLSLVGGAIAFFAVGKPSSPPPIVSPLPAPSPAAPEMPAPAASDLKAELKELTALKSKYGKSVRFIGEITNTGSDAIGYPAAKVTFYDAAGTAVDSGTCASLVRVLPAGDKVPCAFSIFKGLGYSTYKIELTPHAPLFRGQIADIDITDIKFTPKRGYQPHTLEGKLTNKSNFKAKSVWAIVTLYDANKKIVGTDNALVAGNDLDAGQSGLFSAKVYEVAGTPDSYRVVSIGYSE